ncbi:MAG TPA: aminodeoxychorismate synthase component I, partial [Chryseolinea sp.]|nr:aminodeoxychorismate synthase component I [Chryseolinea sp.]
MNISEFKNQMNRWGQEKVPFLFMVDFEMENPKIFKLSDIDDNKILFDINGFKNGKLSSVNYEVVNIVKTPISFFEYQRKFNKVFSHLEYGDSFLTNLTVKTEIKINHTFREIFHYSTAKYKLFYENKFLVFSPETFVKIKGGKIFSYPMKGTIDAAVPNAKEKILSNQKELSEHVTIVDLIRNDLSLVASNVEVNRFRYIEEIRTHSKNLLQVSSEISGVLSGDFEKHMGDVVVTLLPAGSISGAPKQKTIEIIKNAEGEKRGFYTGVFGYFDGESLDSGVMIRYI